MKRRDHEFGEKREGRSNPPSVGNEKGERLLTLSLKGKKERKS